MKLFRRTARSVSGTLGRESALINALRPTYDRLLDWSSGGKGIVQTLNGREQFRIDPHYRVHFPEVYDPSVCDFLRRRVGAGAITLDIGAHVGIYALCMAAWSEPTGRVLAFEPNPATRAALEKHVALNALTERIEVIAQAVSREPGEATFFASELEGFSRLGRANPDRPQAAETTSITVPVTTVDAVCAARGLSPDWIIMDIEGYEAAALEGARETIRKGRGRLGLIVEMHPTLWEMAGTSREKIETLLAELSLRPTGLTGQADPLADYGIVHLEYC
ncbi:MAG: FkbM family methyltransferase [Acidobacteria bacterium]|nr:FkbM family methyltransferase [Acidobacteriota bacterium]